MRVRDSAYVPSDAAVTVRARGLEMARQCLRWKFPARLLGGIQFSVVGVCAGRASVEVDGENKWEEVKARRL